MKRIIFIIMLFSYLLFSSGFLKGQSEINTNIIERGVVKINTSGKDIDTGTGLVIGKISNKVFILTAYHVVKESKNIKIEFYTQDKLYSGIFDKKKFNSKFDIAIVEVKLPSNELIKFNFPEFGMGDVSEIAIYDEVISPCYFGLPKSKIINTSYKLDGVEKLLIKREKIDRGCSGGPVFDEQENILGIITNINVESAYATKIDDISDFLEKWKVHTYLESGSFYYAMINSNPADAEIYINSTHRGQTPTKIRLISGTKYELKIEKTRYATIFTQITKDRKDIYRDLKEKLPPALPHPGTFDSLGSDIEVLKGLTLDVNGAFDNSMPCGGFWICFMNNKMIWPRIEISEPYFKKKVNFAPEGFYRGKVVLVCVLSKDSIEFKRRLNKGSDNPHFIPKEINIILETNVIIEGSK